MTQNVLTTIITIKEKNNFQNCLKSLQRLNCDYIVIDCLGLDNISLYCKSHNIQYKKIISQYIGFADVKNEAINICKTKWMFFIDSNESLINGHKNIEDAVSNLENHDLFSVSVINDFTITKDIRIIEKNKKYKFEHAYFESIIGTGFLLDVYISSKNSIDHKKALQHFLQQENENPNKYNVKYYSASCLLACNMIKEFITKAEEFLFLSKKNEMPQIMINYYLALVKCIKKLNFQDAIQHISICILYKPDMAEFWCCLGDIFYQNNDTDKAKMFYKIAIIAGKKRRKSDLWPLEIKKYKEYPTNMIKSCENIEEKRKQYKKI